MKPHPDPEDYSDDGWSEAEMKPGDLVGVKGGMIYKSVCLWDRPSDYDQDDPGSSGMFYDWMVGVVLEAVRNPHGDDWVRVMESGRIGWILEERLVVLSG